MKSIFELSEIFLSEDEKVFCKAYFECLAWCEESEDKREEIDNSNLTIIEKKADPHYQYLIEQIKIHHYDCLSFYNSIKCYLTDEQVDQAGHDFYLSRNRLGTGFFDNRCYQPCYNKMFQSKAENFGEKQIFF